MTNTKTCPVCAKALDASRLAQWPSAVVCGRRTCSLKYRRQAFNKIRKRYRDRRLANDPALRLRKNQRARERYALRRLAAGKTVVRRPVAPERGVLYTFVAVIRRTALGALRRAGMTNE